MGYPKWHPKHKHSSGNLNEHKGRDQGGRYNNRYPRGSQNKSGKTQHLGSGNRVAANAQGDFDAQSLSSTGTSISEQQREKLLKLLPGGSKHTGVSSQIEDDLENGFTNMVTCCNATSVEHEWIIDSGFYDHMTEDLSMLDLPRKITCRNKINLPNGLTFEISHYGDVTLHNSLRMKNVLHVSDFMHNLLSVTKLVEDNQCKVNFFSGFCMIVSTVNDKVKGVRKSKNGLYYLKNE